MEKIKEEDNENFEKIKIFSSEDEKLKLLGELLSNKSSRDIIKLLMGKEHYTNEIANKLDLRPNLVIHHLKKLEELGLLEIRNKRIVKKGNEHRYFRISPNLFIAPNYNQEEMEEKGTLKKIFKDGIKFMSVAIAAITSFFFTREFTQLDGTKSIRDDLPDLMEIGPYVLPLIVIIVGLLIIYFTKKEKKG